MLFRRFLQELLVQSVLQTGKQRGIFSADGFAIDRQDPETERAGARYHDLVRVHELLYGFSGGAVVLSAGHIRR